MSRLVPRFGLIAAAILAAIAVTAIAGVDSTTQPSIYHSKLDNFTCQVPHMVEGAKGIESADDQNAMVSFSDDIGGLLRIESSKIAADKPALYTGETAKKDLDAFFDDRLMPTEYKAVSPDTKIEARDFVDTAAGQALFVSVSIPGGSTLMDMTPGSPAKRKDSLRGVLVFRQHDFIYVISNQETALAQAVVKKTMKERTDLLQQNLRDVVAGMTFK